jgi:carboxypeptidase family protein/TonB-dependent receptor-like protein
MARRVRCGGQQRGPGTRAATHPSGGKRMVRRIAAALALAVFALAPAVAAQQQTGEIFGKVTDNTGAILPGVTVTLTGEALIQPQTAITSTTGSYQFPRIPIGTYSVKFELPGFKTIVREGIRVTVGFNAEVSQQMELSTVQETVTVTGESPIVDTKETGAKTTFDLETLQNIPSARDPWVMLERVPNITNDRINVGGNQSGQQSGYISRGSSTGNNKWSLDGVDITDMSATGASPIYYDFDMLQEMQVTTGGADASQQTGGVGINFVTRSGTDRFKGSGRLYNTNERFQADNITDEIRAAGAGAGNPIQNINDMGFEVGGPLAKGRLWYWGSIGKQDVKVGVVGFYQNNTTCRPPGVATSDIPKVLDTQTLRDCAATDQTILNNYNWKITAAPFTNNKFNFQNTWAEKVRNARDASDTRPLETAYRQVAVDSSYGRFGWDTGPSPIWKASDQHVFSDRFLAEIQYAHIGNNFTLTFQDPEQRDIQPTFDVTTGIWGRSFQESVFLRPTESIDLTTSYFLPSFGGGDHSLKAGYRWRTARGLSVNHRGGNAIARYANMAANNCSLPAHGCTAELYRDGYTDYDLDTHAAYIQDSWSMSRVTLNVGVRWDQQKDAAVAATVPANPLIPEIMPGIDFPGLESGVVWNDVSPRLGVTYDLFGNAHSIAKASFASYYGQMGPGQLSGELISIGAVFVRYPWTDRNVDGFVQPNELTIVANPVKSGTFDPKDPTNYRSPGRVDPNVKNDRTRELIVGLQQEVARNLGFEVNYIWRKYDRFQWRDVGNWDSSNFQQFTLNPTNCSAAADCAPITYYRATSPLPSSYVYTNVPDRFRNYNGVELSLQKRYSERWMANVSFAFNNAVDHWDSEAAYEDPSCGHDANSGTFSCPGAQAYAPESGGSGIDNIFTNAKWLFKLNGMYTLPLWDINLSGNMQFRQGYPYPKALTVTNRGNGLADMRYILENMGDTRHPNVVYGDLSVSRSFNFGQVRVVPEMAVFNLGNVNTVLARRRFMYSYNATTGVGSSPSNADLISGVVAPRVIRFGLRVQW